MTSLKVTNVAVKNWKAINLKCYYVKKGEDGMYTFYSKDVRKGFIEEFTKGVDESKYQIDVYDHITYLSDINDLQEFGSEMLYRRFRYVINTGSSRSSKTWSINQCLYRYATSYNYKHITILRDIAKHCRELVETDFLDWMRDPNGRVLELQKGEIHNDEFADIMTEETLVNTLDRNKTDHTYETTSKSLLRFTGADDIDSIMGKSQSVLWVNEPYRFSKLIFDQLDQRTTDFVVLDWNPKQKHFIDDLSRHERAIVIHSTYKENPFCPPEQALKIDSYEPTEQNIKNGTADQYLWAVMGLGIKAEMPNKIYRNWKECSLKEFDQLPYQAYYGLDWGLTSPTAIVVCKYDGDGTFYLNELLYESEISITEKVKKQLGEGWHEILQKKGLGIIPYYLDSFGIKKDTDIIVCDSNKPDNIQELRNADYWAVPAKKGAGSVFSGISFIQRANIVVTRNSSNIWSEYDMYEWEFARGMNLERPIKRDDHTMDSINYVTTYMKTHLNISI